MAGRGDDEAYNLDFLVHPAESLDSGAPVPSAGNETGAAPHRGRWVAVAVVCIALAATAAAFNASRARPKHRVAAAPPASVPAPTPDTQPWTQPVGAAFGGSPSGQHQTAVQVYPDGSLVAGVTVTPLAGAGPSDGIDFLGDVSGVVTGHLLTLGETYRFVEELQTGEAYAEWPVILQAHATGGILHCPESFVVSPLNQYDLACTFVPKAAMGSITIAMQSLDGRQVASSVEDIRAR